MSEAIPLEIRGWPWRNGWDLDQAGSRDWERLRFCQGEKGGEPWRLRPAVKCDESVKCDGSV